MANGFPDLRDQTAALGGSAIPLPLLPQPIGLPVAPADAPPVPLFGVAGLGEPIAAPEFLPPEQPLLGLDEFGAIAQPAVGAPPPVDLGQQAIAAPPAPEAGLQQLLDPFASIAPPPEVAVPPAVAGFAPEVDVVPPGAPAALPPTALELLQAPRPELAAATQRVAGLSDEQRRLRTQGQQVVIQLGQATTDEDRQKLRTELGENQTATALNAQQLAVARQSSDEERVVARGEQADDLARFQVEQIQNARAEQQERAVLAEAAQARLDEQQETARTTHQTTLKEHESIVAKSTGPGLGIAVGAMISEALSAFNQRRPPNFAQAMAVYQKQSAEAHRRQVESSRLKVNRTGDAVKDIARQKAEERAQNAASDEAHMRAAVNELDRVVATEQDRDRREAAAFVRDDLRRQADSRAAEAAAERAKQARSQASDDIKDDLALSKIGTEQARAAKLAAETAKLQRRGSGRGGRSKALALGEFPPVLRALAASGPEGMKSAQRQFRQMVIDPVTGEAMTREDDTLAISPSPAIAQKLNEDGPLVARVNSLVNEALAIRGKEGWAPTGDWLGTKAGRNMSQLSTEIMLINKNVLGLGVLNESDIPILLKIQGGELAGMKDPRPQLRSMIRRMTDAYNVRLKTGAPGATPITFPKVSAAPRRTTANITTLLNQPLDPRSGDVPSARAKLRGMDELFETMVGENKGDIEKASDDFKRAGETIRKKNDAHLRDARKLWEQAQPPNWDELQAELGAAGGARAFLADDATGEQVNAADRRLARAARAAKNSLGKRATRIRANLEEMQEFNDGLESKLAGESRKKAQVIQLRKEEREQAQQRVDDFAAGQNIPSGARGF